TLLWHHRLGHPSVPHLRGMHSRLLVSGLPRSLPPLPPSPAPPCLPCVEGWQCATHSSSVPPTTAPLQTLHMDVWGPARRGEFSSNLLRNMCHGEGILQSFTLPDSPQQNGIAERRIGLVKEVARTSMIHAAAPLFLWPFAVWYAAHQLNLWPRVFLPETSPTLRWMGEVGDASVFWFYHPTSRRVFPSQDFMFDELVPIYRLFPYRSAPPPPSPLFLAPGPPAVDPLPPRGPAPSGVSQVDPLPCPALVEVAVVSGAARGDASGGAASGGAEPGGAESEGAGSGGAEPGGAQPMGVEPEGVEPGGAESEGVESEGAEPRGVASSGGPAGALPQLSPQQLRFGGVEGTGAEDPTEPGATRAGGARARGAGARAAGAVDPGAGGAGDTVRPRPYFVPLLQQVLGVPSSPSLTPPLLCPPPDHSQLPLQPASPLLAPSPCTKQSDGISKRREPASFPVSPVRTARRVPRSRPPPVPGTHAMALRPCSFPLRVPLPAPPESSLPEVPDPTSDRARAPSPTIACLLATFVTDPSFESAVASALVAELVDFAVACRLNYATAFVAESESAGPPSVGGECALGTDVLEDRKEDFECLAATVPRFASMLLALEGDPDAPDILTPCSYAKAITGRYSSQWQAAMDAEMASWKSTGTYVSEVPPPGANIGDGMWIFRVKRPPGSPPAFKARYVARASSGQSTVSARRLASGTTLAALGFAPSTADPLLRDTPALTWVLQRFGFQFSSPQPTPLSTSHSLSAQPLDESVEPSGPYPELVGCLMYLMTCTRPDLAYPLSLLARYVAPVLRGRGPVVLTGHADASWVDDSATQRSSQGYTFSLDSGCVSWRSTRSSSVLNSSCEAEIYAGAMATQELRWLTYLLTD
ncbi:unnamed protein product, partial [Closterium sp. NIES-53]